MAHICTGQLCTVKVKNTDVNFLFVVFIVFVLVMYGIFSTKISDVTGVSQSLLLLLAGLGIGVYISSQTSFGDNIDPKTVLWILLPALLFESGIDTDYHIFENLFLQIMLLAVPGVVFCAFLNG
jgi:NhaP-type Na+/H+ or K+/H+ antiporter